MCTGFRLNGNSKKMKKQNLTFQNTVLTAELVFTFSVKSMKLMMYHTFVVRRGGRASPPKKLPIISNAYMYGKNAEPFLLSNVVFLNQLFVRCRCRIQNLSTHCKPFKWLQRFTEAILKQYRKGALGTGHYWLE